MAKVRKVTRTILSTNVELEVINKDTKTHYTKVLEIAGHFDEEEEIITACSPLLPANERALYVVEATRLTVLRGMTETDFIKYSTPIVKTADEEIVVADEF